MPEDLLAHGRVLHDGDQAHVAAALGAHEHVFPPASAEPVGPGQPASARGVVGTRAVVVRRIALDRVILANGRKAQASAAAAGALTLPGRGQVVFESIAAHARQEKCSGCRSCLEQCPHSAVGFDEGHRRAEIDDTSCRGCGTCVATCPAGALTQDHFTAEQLFAAIAGLRRWDEPQPAPPREATAAPVRTGATAGNATAQL